MKELEGLGKIIDDGTNVANYGSLTPRATKDPSYVLERHPYKEGECKITVWLKTDDFDTSSGEIAEMIGKLLQSQVKEAK